MRINTGLNRSGVTCRPCNIDHCLSDRFVLNEAHRACDPSNSSFTPSNFSERERNVTSCTFTLNRSTHELRTETRSHFLRVSLTFSERYVRIVLDAGYTHQVVRRRGAGSRAPRKIDMPKIPFFLVDCAVLGQVSVLTTGPS